MILHEKFVDRQYETVRFPMTSVKYLGLMMHRTVLVMVTVGLD